MKSLRTGIRRILFLLRPWVRYGKGVLLLSGFGHIVLLSISGYFVATVAQRIIDKVQNGGTFREALFIAIFSLVIVWVSSLLMDCIEDFYVHWKKEEVAGRIEQEIYKQALITDQRHFNSAEYLDSYKLATEEFVQRSTDTMEQIIQFSGSLTRFLLFGALITIRGTFIIAVVVLCAGFAAIAQMYWSKVSANRTAQCVRARRKSDYIRRLFFHPTAVENLKTTGVRGLIFGLLHSSIEERVSVYKRFARKEFVIDLCSFIALRGTEFAVPLYVAWGLLSGHLSGSRNLRHFDRRIHSPQRHHGRPRLVEFPTGSQCLLCGAGADVF